MIIIIIINIAQQIIDLLQTHVMKLFLNFGRMEVQLMKYLEDKN